MAKQSEEDKSVAKLINEITTVAIKRFGNDAVYDLDSEEGMGKIPYFISTGNLALDRVIGGGIPAGRLTEIYGDFSTGKSLLGMKILSNVQKMGGLAIYFDAEATLDSEWGGKVTGLDFKHNFSGARPDTIETVSDALMDIIQLALEEKDKKPICVVVDSIAALSFVAEMEKDTSAAEVGRRANLWSKSLRKMVRLLAKSGICLIFINQVRENIGIMWGPKTSTPGGKAIKFHSSLRLELRLVKKIEVDEEVTGVMVSAESTKNKVAPPFKKVIFALDYEKGINQYDGIAALLTKSGVITCSGGWYAWKDKKFRESELEQLIKDNPDILT